ncbi:efflux RND transporter periplasmic adaptor subunit [Rhodobacteraceae bacterium RKSG542]|nr:efflux RND transporter periplasmic adaptor subunit [Pseudovibrio flavus]
MNKALHRRKPLLGASSLLIAAGLLLAGCQQDVEETVKEEAPRPAKVMQASQNLNSATRSFAGRVEAVQTVDLAFRVGGQLVQLPVRESQMVKKGDLIAALDPTDYESALREAKVNFEQKKLDLKRLETLKDKDVVSQGSFDNAKTAYDLAAVAVDNAERNLRYTKLLAPYDAVITRRLLDNFTIIQGGTSVVRVQDVSEIQVDINVPETLFARVNEGDIQKIHAEFAALPGKEFPVTYREHSTEVDPVTQTYRVTLTMPQVDGIDIYPGMTASVKVETSSSAEVAEKGFLVPTVAVVSDADKKLYLWVVGEGNKVERRYVEVGPIMGPFIPVLSGLNQGETFVTAGAASLQSGQTIQPIK